jgi:hypothetical protein
MPYAPAWRDSPLVMPETVRVRMDAGHPVGMGSPAPPPVRAASSAADLPWSLLRLVPGLPEPDAMPERWMLVLVETCPGRLLAQR